MMKLIGKCILFFLYTIGVIYVVSLHIKNKMDQVFLKKHGEAVKFRSYYNTLEQWFRLLQEGKTIAAYFNKEDTIAIYGMGNIGALICQELETHKLNVVCGIDKNSSGKNLETGLEVYSVECNRDLNMDYIIISIPYMADEIVPMLKTDKETKIVTIDEIIQSLL